MVKYKKLKRIWESNMNNKEECNAINYEQVLDNYGFVSNTIVGRSMYPMLRNRRDTIVIVPVDGELKKNDVPLYRRDGKYILHRIISVKTDYYIIRGDNCLEKEYVTKDMIIGRLAEFYRDEKKVSLNSFSYKLYVLVWSKTFGVRLLYKKSRGCFSKITKRFRNK